MKYKKDPDVTYLNNLQEAWYANEVADIKDIHSLLANFKAASTLFTRTIPLFFIIDYTARQYLLMTDSIMSIGGYHPKEFMESGLDKLMEIFHKEDFIIFNAKVFTRNAAFLSSTPFTEHSQYTFNYNFRFARADKKYADVLQRSSYITSKETGLPLYSLGTITDITNIKTDAAIVHTIEKNGPGYAPHIVEKNFYFPNEEDALLTARERCILQYMAEGMSSKQIAYKLKISENTIGNHRQNMLRKTNTKNVAELIAFSIRNRII